MFGKVVVFGLVEMIQKKKKKKKEKKSVRTASPGLGLASDPGRVGSGMATWAVTPTSK